MRTVAANRTSFLPNGSARESRAEPTLAASKSLRVEERAARWLRIHRLSETRELVQTPGPCVELLNLQRHSATAKFSSPLLDSRQKLSSDALAAVLGPDREIVDVDERPGAKSRKPPEAGGDAHGVAVDVGEKDQGRRMIFQTWDEPRERLGRKRSAIAHRVQRVSRREGEHILLMVGPTQIGFDDFGYSHPY